MLFFYDKKTNGEGFISVSEPLPGGWIHVDEAKSEDLQKICTLTGLDLAFLYDALDRYELPRVEQLSSCLLIFTRHPIEQERSLHTGTLAILLTHNYFITISPIKSFLLQHVLEKKILIRSSVPSDWMRHILLWIAQEFNLVIRKTRYNVISQEKELSSVTSEYIYALTRYEEILNQYLSSLDASTLALERLLTIESSHVYKQNKEVVEDILNHVKQSESLCEILIKNIRSVRDSYQIIFANSMTKTIKLLTSLTIVVTVPNIIASIYGMNVRLPLAENSEAFLLILGIMLALSSLCGYWFYRKNWM